MNIISYKLQKCKIFSISLFFYSDDLKKKKKRFRMLYDYMRIIKSK